MKPMYSTEWFDTYAATVPAAITEADVGGIAAHLPAERFRRIVDIGCGIGRVSGPLAALGYQVTGIDVHLAALREAKRQAPGPRYVALDQSRLGHMKWTFDAALFLWNSLGFVGRSTDLETLRGVAGALRPGGAVAFDLYHPDWLERNPRSGEADQRGSATASVRRWTRDGRCFHEIRYPTGQVDDIQFDVYQPEEIRELAGRAGLEPVAELVWWNGESRPSAEHPRYQLICRRA